MRQAAAESSETTGGGVGFWRATIAGLCAMLVGIGLARFSYTPLIPALIEAEWFDPAEAAYLAAANLAGYLAGALLAAPMAKRASAPFLLRLMMALTTVSFFACATPISFSWYFLWRLLSGATGGALMVLAASTVLRHVPAGRRGLAGGVIFTGVGLGIAFSGTLVPVLLAWGLTETWIGLGVLSLLMTGVAWGGWPRDDGSAEPSAPSRRAPRSPALTVLYIVYGLIAAGLVAHMVFLVDFVARGLDKGIGVGSIYWIVFGVGAMVGPMIAGALADVTGFRPASRLTLFAAALCVALVVASQGPVALAVSSFVIGGVVPGIVPLIVGRVHDLVPGDPAGQRAAWGLATTAFAVGQAGAAYGFSYVFARIDGAYLTLFGLSAGALALALAIDVLGSRARRPAESRPFPYDDCA